MNISSWNCRKILLDERDIMKTRHPIKGTHWGDVIATRQFEDGYSIHDKIKSQYNLYRQRLR